MVRLDKSAARTRKHPPTTKKVAEAHAAAASPGNAKLAGAKANQVDVMQEAKASKPEPKSFLEVLRAAITSLMPTNMEDARAFAKGEQKPSIKDTMRGNFNQQKAEATGEIQAATTREPDTSQAREEQPTPLPADKAAVAPLAVGAADAIPAPKANSEVSLQESKQEANEKLKEAEVTPEQLKEANDPRFNTTLTAKTAVDAHADAAPQHYRADEQKLLMQETVKAAADEQQGLLALQGECDKSSVAVKLSQMTAQAKNETQRKDVADHIEGIYAETKKMVEDKLNSLETEATTMFDQGVEAAMTKMTDYINSHEGFSGFLLKVGEVVFGLPDEVKDIYQQGRDIFMQELDSVVINVANLVETRLKEAKDEIARGQQSIHEYVLGLPKNLQVIGKAAEREIAGRFDELRQGVDAKRDDLAQKLAQHYKDAFEKADTKLKELQEEYKSLFEKFEEKLGEVVKVLGDFRERITNMLKVGRDTVMLIVARPIDFLKHLLDAIKQGLDQFVTNIWEHLKAGFLSWLFGTLEKAGIVLPQDTSLGSILKLILQVLGLTYERIRPKIAKVIGERNLAIIEKVGQVIYTLVTGGPEALWEQFKEFLGDLKEMVIGAIQDWIVTNVIKSAVTKLVTMFNPVGAIIQAILTIYNAVMFFIERINQILTFVEAIINSVTRIARGDISSAANWIERALAKTVPIIISFLARLLGLGDISEKIQKIIQKAQDYVDKALDKLIDKIVKWVRKLFGKKEEGKEEDVREKTHRELLKQLEGEHTKEQIKGIVGQIFRQLQPQGLKRLELGQEDEEGSFPIITEASPIKHELLLEALGRTGAVTNIAGTVRYRKPKRITTRFEKEPEIRFEGEKEVKIRYAKIPALSVSGESIVHLIHPGSDYAERPSSFAPEEVREEPVEAQEFQFVVSSKGKGQAHAEVQFITLIQSQMKELGAKNHMGDIESIKLLSTNSPCSKRNGNCTDRLCAFTNRIKAQREAQGKDKDFEFILIYENLWTKKGEETDIGALNKCGITVEPRQTNSTGTKFIAKEGV